MTAAPFTHGERLAFVAECFTSAVTDDVVIWNTLLAMDRAMPLIKDADPEWRAAGRAEIDVICAQIYRVGPMLADVLDGQVPRQMVLFGLASMASALRSSEATHLSDRAAYARILLCRLSIVLDLAALADRGYPLADEVEAHLALFTRSSPSEAVH